MAYEAKNCVWMKFEDGPRDTFDIKVGQYNRQSADYSLDLETWTPIAGGQFSPQYTTVTLNKGDTIYLKATPCAEDNLNNCVRFSCDVSDQDEFYFSAGGSIAGLVTDGTSDFYDDDNPKTSIANQVFSDCACLKDISELKLGFKVAPRQGFAGMFGKTGILEIGPSFFEGLEKIGTSSFMAMFRNSKLKVIHANLFDTVTSYDTNAFRQMFLDCKDLVAVGDNVFPIEDSTNAIGPFSETFKNCTSLKKFSKTSWRLTNTGGGIGEMMFSGCTSLEEIGVNFTDWGDFAERQSWVQGVADYGKFYCPETLPLDRSENAIPPMWEVKTESDKCLTVTAIEDTTLTFAGYQFFNTSDMSGAWVDDSISLRAGESARIKGDHFPYYDVVLASTGAYSITSGSIMSLVDNGEGMLNSIPDRNDAGFGAFYSCFSDDSDNLKSIHGELLSAQDIGEDCYHAMFTGTSIETVPADLLPAPIVPREAYSHMFSGCGALQNIEIGFMTPALIKSYGCQEMFYRCSALSELYNVVLDAEMQGESCYSGMFGYTAVVNLPDGMLPQTKLVNYCYQEMFCYCENIGTLPDGLLIADKLAKGCYNRMFIGCSSLTNIQSNALPATQGANQCYEYMFDSCGFMYLDAGILKLTELCTDCFYGMFSYNENLNEVPTGFLPWTNLASGCYEFMFDGCSNLTTLGDNLLPAITLAPFCYAYMFNNCVSLVELPDNLLPATQLVNQCYAGMFSNCESLEKVTVSFDSWDSLTKDTDEWPPTDEWMMGVAEDGNFYCPDNLTQIFDESHIPEGWTVNGEGPTPPAETERAKIVFLGKYSAGLHK